MQDTLARRIQYLRLSITPACAMRCVYCRPATFGNSHDFSLMSVHEMTQLVEHLVRHHGLRKVRVTGGEPTSRADLLEIIAQLSAIKGLHELAMTTNGLTLARQAKALFAAGLQRINVSVDSLDSKKFAAITGVDGLSRVLAGIDAAQDAGLDPVKINAVVVRGQNENDLPSLVDFAAKKQLELRFIELMPMGPLADQWAARYVPEAEMRRTLATTVAQWQPLERDAASARRYHVTLHDGRTAKIGFVTAMSGPFCDRCDRIRIASDGGFYPCLMDHPRGSVLPALRPIFDGDLLDDILAQGLSHKASEHPAVGIAVMTKLGG